MRKAKIDNQHLSCVFRKATKYMYYFYFMKLDVMRQHILILCSYAILVWIFLFTSGTLFSGFHLSDDQILIAFNNRLEKQDFFSAAWFEIKDDLFLRFRPLAILYYMLLAKWAYPNFTLVAFLVSLQSIFTCYLFYRFARYLKCNPVLAFLFPLFILCGNQGVVFWRNCVNETPGMFLLSISFFYLGKLLHKKNNSRLNTLGFAFFLFLSTLTKESFIILVPALLFLKIWYESLDSGRGYLFSLKQNSKLVIFFTVTCLAEIAVIYYYKNQSNRFIQYVGIDKSTFNVSNLYVSLVRLWITKGYLVIIVPTVIYIFFTIKKYNKDVTTFFLPLALLFLLITLPQILLYSKSLIFERYLLPGTLGSALAILFLQEYIIRHPSTLKTLNKIFLPGCALFLCLQTVLMTRGAVAYANTGYEVKKMLATVIQHTTPADTILIIANSLGQSDQALSTKKYLNAGIGGRRNSVFIEPLVNSAIKHGTIEKVYEENFLTSTKGMNYKDIRDTKNIDCYIFFRNSLEKFMYLYPDLDTSKLVKITGGEFLIFSKKN